MTFMQFLRILNIIFKKTFFITSFIIVFFEILFKLRMIFDPFKYITGKFCNIKQLYESYYISIFMIWWCFILITIFHIFIIRFCISMNYVTYSSSNFFFNHSISISVNNSNFTSVFCKAACHANPKAERNFKVFKWWIFKLLFWGFQKHQLNLMYRL